MRLYLKSWPDSFTCLKVESLLSLVLMTIHLAHLSGAVTAFVQYLPVPSWIYFFIGSPDEKIIASCDAADININPFSFAVFLESHELTSVTFFWLEPTFASSIDTASLLAKEKKVTNSKSPIMTGLSGLIL